MYYMAVTTRMNYNCGFVEVDSEATYCRASGCDCIREWLPDKSSCKEARQILWFGCLHDPAKGADWRLSTQVRYHLLAENEFSIKVVNPFYGWTIGQESITRVQWRSLYPPKPDAYPECDPPQFRQLPAGYNMCGVSAYMQTVLDDCERMQTALDADCWTATDVADCYHRQSEHARTTDCSTDGDFPVVVDPLDAATYSGKSYFSCLEFSPLG